MRRTNASVSRRKRITKDEWQWLAFLALPVLFVLVFHYGALYGVVIAFQKFIPAKGLFGNQKWVGLSNFKYVLSLHNVWRAIFNTLSISVWKIILGILVPVLMALIRVLQTTVSSRFGVRVTSRNAASPGRSITVAIVFTKDIIHLPSV